MKSTLILCISLFAFACTSAPKITIQISNPIAIERTNETVEIAWSDVIAKLADLTPQSVVVIDAANTQIPSQVVYNGATEPQSLIFQATVPSLAQAQYSIVTGEREEYPIQAFGRYVPERSDDYAWENNLTAYRLYGPALTDPISPGIDVWVKCGGVLVIDSRYKRADYHHNYGDGMDCYKVGKTLGAGACAPLIDGKLYLSENYQTYQTLDNGPIRTAVKLTYAPFAAGNDTVSMEKIISLDANTHFSKMINTYNGEFETLPIGAGAVMHDVKYKASSDDYVAIMEAASDSAQPDVDGDIALAVIMPEAVARVEADGHIMTVGNALNGQPLTYWSGTGWSGADVANGEAWETIVKTQTQKINNPLQTTIK